MGARSTRPVATALGLPRPEKWGTGRAERLGPTLKGTQDAYPQPRLCWASKGRERATPLNLLSVPCPLGLVFCTRVPLFLQLLPRTWPRAEPPTTLTFDHANIVGTISDGQGDGVPVLLHQLHHLGLLQRSHPAADHRFAQAGRVHQQFRELPLQRIGLPGAQRMQEMMALLPQQNTQEEANSPGWSGVPDTPTSLRTSPLSVLNWHLHLLTY